MKKMTKLALKIVIHMVIIKNQTEAAIMRNFAPSEPKNKQKTHSETRYQISEQIKNNKSFYSIISGHSSSAIQNYYVVNPSALSNHIK